MPKVVYGTQAHSKIRNYPKLYVTSLLEKESCGGIGESTSLIYLLSNNLNPNTTKLLKTSDRSLLNLWLTESLMS